MAKCNLLQHHPDVMYTACQQCKYGVTSAPIDMEHATITKAHDVYEALMFLYCMPPWQMQSNFQITFNGLIAKHTDTQQRTVGLADFESIGCCFARFAFAFLVNALFSHYVSHRFALVQDSI